MNPVAVMFVAYACISHGDHKPDGFAVSRVYMCVPPAAEVQAAAVPVRVVKRKSVRKVKLADRCGSQKAVWYFNKKENRRKYKCQ